MDAAPVVVAAPASAPASAATPVVVTDATPIGAADPFPTPSVSWAIAQLIPSPEMVGGTEGAYFGLRWQVTPLLYSFGLRKPLRPWRTLVVEPIARHSGSVELYVSPEYLFHGDAADRFLIRPGVRGYVPIYQRGEYVSMSAGASYFHVRDHDGAAFELGVYGLYGVFGAVATYSPSFGPTTWMGTFNIRFF